MTCAFEEIVEQLAQIALDDYLEEPEQLEQLMVQRRGLLTALEQSDTSELAPELRAHLKARLQGILERDRLVLQQLAELHVEAQKSLEQLSSGRAAVRGYGEALESSRPPARRLG